ncbi:MAG: hypothetical protein IKW39_01760 [Alphaproteobacteria bacterium]|nr:hypothetical protein [Alphaproteobacteria bacterium]
MKKYLIYLGAIICVVLVGFFTCCKEEKKVEETPVVIEEPTPEPYKAKHTTTTVDLAGAKTYQYFDAQKGGAVSVSVDYPTTPYSKPIVIKYAYANGDTHTYIIPETFGLWKNEAGKLRVVTDENYTVWVQGQTKKGKFHEFIFYADPKFNGTKINPNSYLNPPSGLIKYRN